MYDYRCVVRRVVDGDTIDVNIDLGFDMWLHERIRLYGVNTPEIRGKQKAEGLISAARVRELLPENSKAVIQTFYDKRGKFGRVVADFVFEDGQTLSQILLDEGLAVPYTKRK